ncbi:lef-4 [Antheraea pernyi nucleopolyhedrovirus]|uniref:Late expression factor 4 n=2 Tax=Antheraea pernyi nuclear polyhedrosis virus TaxID=161494 RepID=Q1HH31_NPVAP|nr:lef-4 [Antheraea pernyi nucleopolyhedrovirus]AWD33586.1 late expression factor 4 [Antheraea proylei nucleopolyhedrovirus]ABF50302.1 lef-4 [Antheraea pernyi nucleopolyhedrovirus]ABQ12294.1 late expression factor 4 [Antheraea pernyi nucleopolyhedrovirus]AYW35413.1 lef-4 [Antheraea proylei nucleopolyhedrovirus]BAX08838.1 late expression factor 4 [Antheraea pernyi nucleopolyhedrovirus]
MEGGDFVIEKEISYTINFSQDVLYLILDSYIVRRAAAPAERYVDVYDENGVRTRLAGDGVASVRKITLRDERLVHWLRSANALVPLVCRENREAAVPPAHAARRLASLVDTTVYRLDGVDVKFEHVYLHASGVDKHESATAHKIVALKNALLNISIAHPAQNLQLGSDAVLARLRLELEFAGAAPTGAQLDAFCALVVQMEALADHQNIAPALPYTTLLDKAVPRKFVREHKIAYGAAALDSTGVKKWAFKLDGVRGRGAFRRGFVLVQTDDMRLYSAQVAHPFALNNVVTFQCEVLQDKIFVTDLLQVFRYKYNNRTQYECNLQTAYSLDAALAVECLNYLHNAVGSVALPQFGELQFQQFHDPPLAPTHYTTVAIDGYIVLDERLQYAKYKWMPTVELEYDAPAGTLNSIDGPLLDRVIVADVPLQHKVVYECAFTDTVINVLKARPDRIVPSKVC